MCVIRLFASRVVRDMPVGGAALVHPIPLYHALAHLSSYECLAGAELLGGVGVLVLELLRKA